MTEPTELSQLTTELVEAQKAKADLQKWKIGLIAVLMATGFGLLDREDAAEGYADLALCAIPLVCAYVDALCAQQGLRISVIGAYRRRHPDAYSAYEAFADRARGQRAYAFDTVALAASSVLACSALVVLPRAIEPDLPHATTITWSGVAGLVVVAVVFGVQLVVDRRVARLDPTKL